jgi:hypothetical protein
MPPVLTRNGTVSIDPIGTAPAEIVGDFSGCAGLPTLACIVNLGLVMETSTFKKTVFALCLLPLASLFGAAGCAVDADSEESAESEDDLSSSAQKLVGAFQDKGNAATPPTFKGLVFKGDGTFFADVDSGIRPMCLPGGPCPSPVTRIKGRFTAGTKFITLSAPAGEERSTYHGRYAYTLNGSKLSLSRKFYDVAWTNSLSKEISHCRAAADCYEQALIVPACLGSFSCNAEDQCRWACGNAQCGGRSQERCTLEDGCQPTFGPSSCTPDGTRCTRDFVYKGCRAR